MLSENRLHIYRARTWELDVVLLLFLPLSIVISTNFFLGFTGIVLYIYIQLMFQEHRLCSVATNRITKCTIFLQRKVPPKTDRYICKATKKNLSKMRQQHSSLR